MFVLIYSSYNVVKMQEDNKGVNLATSHSSLII